MILQENWVLCRIVLKRRSNNDEAVATRNSSGSEPVFYDFMSREKADLNYSSGSSGITEISNRNESDDHDHDHEESSSCNTFSTRNACF